MTKIIEDNLSKLQPFLLKILEVDKDAHILGGYLRDILYFNTEPRDIDIILPTFSGDLINVFRNEVIYKNHFGGLKIRTNIKDFYCDVWKMSEHQPPSKSIKTVLDNVILNTEQIAYKLSTKRLIVSENNCGIGYEGSGIWFVRKPECNEYFQNKVRSVIDKAPDDWYIKKEVWEFVN